MERGAARSEPANPDAGYSGSLQRAERAAADAIKNSHADITSQIFATVYPIYVDSLEPAMQKLLSEYYAYIIAIFSKELHCSYDDVAAKFDFNRSNGAILGTSDNARANILKALQVFPNNGNVIGYAIKNGVLDDELCEFGKNISESFGLALKKWAISALIEIHKAGKLFNKPLVTNENRAIIEGLKQYYKVHCPHLEQCQDWQDIITTAFLEDISKHLTEFSEIAVAQASILIPEEFDKLAKSGKQFHLSNESKILFVCLYHDLAFEGAYTSASLLDLTAPFSANDIDTKICELNEKLNSRSSLFIKQEAERRENERRAEEKRKTAERLKEIKRQEEIKQQQEIFKRKIKRFMLIFIPIVSVSLIFLIFLNTFIIPNHKYNDAIALMNEGQYESAIFAFEELGGYKDSLAQIENCNTEIMDTKYNNAIALMNSGKYEEAIIVFETLEGYKSAKSYLQEAYYCQGTHYYNLKDYERAKSSFNMCLEHMDSTFYIKECEKGIAYYNAKNLLELKDYEKALEIFQYLGGFEDSQVMVVETKKLIVQANYTEAISLYEWGQYKAALEKFKTTIGFKNTDAMIKNCNQIINDINNICGYYYPIGEMFNGTYKGDDGYHNNEWATYEVSYNWIYGYISIGKISDNSGICVPIHLSNSEYELGQQNIFEYEHYSYKDWNVYITINGDILTHYYTPSDYIVCKKR